MFERYTEKARRAIFFARYEASNFGSPQIDTEHLLLGILREHKALANRFLRSFAAVESVRKQIEAQGGVREKIATSVDLPLSVPCKRVLAYAAEEAEVLQHENIGAEHLFLGILREKESFGEQILRGFGVSAEQVRAYLAETGVPTDSPAGRSPESVAERVRQRMAELQPHLDLLLIAEDDSLAADLRWNLASARVPQVGEAIKVLRGERESRYRILDVVWEVAEAAENPSPIGKVTLRVREENPPGRGS
jgi:ATP-dependent Clp protease ATP-binding subunit ClpA